MNTTLLWFLLANAGFAILWGFYRIFLHRDTLFAGKRFVLLSGMLFATIYPLLNPADWMLSFRPIQNLSQDFSILLPEITVRSAASTMPTTQEYLLYGYILVAGILLLRIVFQFIRLIVLSRRNPSTYVDGQKIICLPNGSAPFSFFGLVFMQPDEHSERDFHEILHHERTHIRQLHSLDVLLAEIVCTVFWINPFAWLLKYDIRENLEFLADKDVVHAGFDPKGYQYHLLRLSYQQSPIRMGNNFNVSQLQNRIKMMNKKRTSQAGWSKYLLTLPLFGSLLLVSYTCKAKTSNESMVSTTIESVSTAKSAETIKTDVPPPPPVPKKSTIRFVAPKIEKGEKKTVKFTPPVLIDAADSVYMSVEQIPEYPGGTEALIKYIRENLHYPQSAKEAGIEGRVVIRFVVSKTGRVEDIKVMRGLSKECDDEAVRVVKGMPQWKAGMNKGKPVNVYFTLPIEYRYKE